MRVLRNLPDVDRQYHESLTTYLPPARLASESLEGEGERGETEGEGVEPRGGGSQWERLLPAGDTGGDERVPAVAESQVVNVSEEVARVSVRAPSLSATPRPPVRMAVLETEGVGREEMEEAVVGGGKGEGEAVTELCEEEIEEQLRSVRKMMRETGKGVAMARQLLQQVWS